MNYKRIIKSRQVRFAILRTLRWIPDSVMVRVQYRVKTGRWPQIKHPKRFTEKLQTYKLCYRNPLMTQCADKYDVRHYVEEKGMKNILIDLYGIYNKVDEIDLEQLPNSFVAKLTDGTGGQDVFIVEDKNKLDKDIFKSFFNERFGKKDVNPGREWSYRNIGSSRIIIERLLEEEDGLIDYKFFCFNGEPHFLYVISGREMGQIAKLGIYDREFNKLPVYRCDELKDEKILEKPRNYDEMLRIARKLSEDFPHVRVDLYNINGKIYFGELTFYDGSGYFLRLIFCAYFCTGNSAR